jgi:ribulose kinase
LCNRFLAAGVDFGTFGVRAAIVDSAPEAKIGYRRGHGIISCNAKNREAFLEGLKTFLCIPSIR